MRGSRFLPLVLLVAAATALMTYQARRGKRLSPPFLKPAASAAYGAIDAGQRAYAALKDRFETGPDRRIKALQTRLAALERKVAALETLKSENERLRMLLGLKDRNASFVAAANVILRGTSPWANTFIIDAGSRQGVRRNMTAVSPDGLAGKVIGIQESSSRILLINDIRFAAAVRIESTGQETIFAGTGAKNHCELKYVTQDMGVRKGDILVTSGLDGLFPPGLRVGYVSSISKGDGFFQDVQVTPYVNTTRLSEVAVINGALVENAVNNAPAVKAVANGPAINETKQKSKK